MKNKNKLLLLSFIALLLLISFINPSIALADTIDPNTTVDCGTFAEITKPIALAIMIISPIILLVMGTVDFMGAVAASDDKAMKKAINNFIKRLIICVVILLLPILVNFVISWTAFGDLTSCW